MTHLPTRLSKLLGLTGFAALALALLAGPSPATAAPGQALSGLAAVGSPVEKAGYYKRHYRSYRPYAYGGYPGSYGYRYPGNGHDEIRELQRLFPSTNWPASMRYHQY
jgi:hypothetical protein